MDYNPGANTSWAWRRICHVKNIYKDFLFNSDGTPKLQHYSMKERYWWVTRDNEPVEWWPWMQNRWITPKHQYTVWLIAHQRLLTRARLAHLNLINETNCCICDDGLENVDHLFFKCRFSKLIMDEIGEWSGIQLPKDDCIKWWLRYRARSATKKKMMGIIIAASIYEIWYARNIARLELSVTHPKIVRKRIQNVVMRRIDSLEIETNCPSIRGWTERLKMDGTD